MAKILYRVPKKRSAFVSFVNRLVQELNMHDVLTFP